MSAKDSRRDPRTKILSLTVRYKSATVAQFVENHSYDVSRGGLFIRTGSPFPAGTLLKFQVRIAGEQKLIEGVGRVTWRREQDSSSGKPAGMGVKFIKISAESIALIDELVSRRNDAASQFEEGARDQGIPLSNPPPNLRSRVTPSPASPRRLESVRTQAEPQPDSARRGDAPDSWLGARTSSKAESVDEEERATLPTGEALQELANQLRRSDAPPAPQVAGADSPESATSGGAAYQEAESEAAKQGTQAEYESEAAKQGTQAEYESEAAKQGTQAEYESEAAKQEPESEDQESEDQESEDQDAYSASSSAPPAGSREPPRDSKRPKGKRGKRKNPKKRKKKFRYSSLPAPPPGFSSRPGAKAPAHSADTDTGSVPASARPALSAPEAVSSTSRWWLAALAATVLGGGLLLYFGTKSDDSAPLSPPASATAAAAGPSQARLDVPVAATPTAAADAQAPPAPADEQAARAPTASVAPTPEPPPASPKPLPQRATPGRRAAPPKPVAPPPPAPPVKPPAAPAAPPVSAPAPKPTAGPTETASPPPVRDEPAAPAPVPAPAGPPGTASGPTGAAPQATPEAADDEVLGSRR